MVKILPPSSEQTAAAVKTAQILTLVKENQLVTALICFILWQIGALTTAQSYVGGVMC